MIPISDLKPGDEVWAGGVKFYDSAFKGYLEHHRNICKCTIKTIKPTLIELKIDKTSQTLILYCGINYGTCSFFSLYSTKEELLKDIERERLEALENLEKDFKKKRDKLLELMIK